jgi:uncharacterized protein (DUF2147 family)
MRLTVFSLCVIGLVGLAGAVPAQTGSSVRGRWLTQDQKGVVEIFGCGQDTMCGNLVWLKPDPAKPGPARDEHNPDPNRRNRPLCDLTILYGFKQSDPGLWSGYIYSPEDGEVYTANMHVEDGKLKLRGYVGIPLLGQTQTWTPAGPQFAACHAG